MITFEAFKKRLAHGQLKNTSAVDEDNLGIIDPKYNDTILTLTNQGLDDLSTRLTIKKSQVDLTFVDDQNIYPLIEANLVPGNGAANGSSQFLSDSAEEPFTDDAFVKILDVFDEDGNRHSANTNGHIMTPSFNTLRFTVAKIEELSAVGEATGKVRIRYQQKHLTITAGDSINIPPNLETALQLFVASLYISHMGGEAHSAKGDSYFAAYLRHIGEDEMRDLSSTSEVDTNTKFDERGFV